MSNLKLQETDAPVVILFIPHLGLWLAEVAGDYGLEFWALEESREDALSALSDMISYAS